MCGISMQAKAACRALDPGSTATALRRRGGCGLERRCLWVAIYSLSVSNVSRGGGSSTLATLSYITARRVRDERLGLTFYGFGRRERVESTGVMLPEGAPQAWRDPVVLFNAIEAFEKPANARCGKKIIVALAREWDTDQAEEVLREFIGKHVTSLGYGCAYAIHTDKQGNNPHAHILVANRVITKHGEFGAKQKMVYVLDDEGNRVPIIDKKTGVQKVDGRNRKQWKRRAVERNPLDEKTTLEGLRVGWEQVANQYLEAGHRIDHRSLEAQGVDRVPTVHEGYAAREMVKRGQRSDRAQVNAGIRQANQQLGVLAGELGGVQEKLADLIGAIASRIRELAVRAFKAVIDRVRLDERVKSQDEYARGLHREGVSLWVEQGDYTYQASGPGGGSLEMRGAELGSEYTKDTLERVFAYRKNPPPTYPPTPTPAASTIDSQEHDKASGRVGRDDLFGQIHARAVQASIEQAHPGISQEEAALRAQAQRYSERTLAELRQRAHRIEAGELGKSQGEYETTLNTVNSLIGQVEDTARQAQQASIFKRGTLTRQAQELAEHNTATLHEIAPWTSHVTIPPTGGPQCRKSLQQATYAHYRTTKALPELAEINQQISQQETYKTAHDQVRQADQYARIRSIINAAKPVGTGTPSGRIQPNPRPHRTQRRGRSL